MIGEHRIAVENRAGLTLAELRALIADADVVGLSDDALVGVRLRTGKAPTGTSRIKLLAAEGGIVRKEAPPQ